MFKKGFFISIFVIVIIILNTNNSTSSITTRITNNGKSPKEIPIARLVIDSLKIDNPIYNYNSKNNTVEKNVQLLDGSIFPNNNSSIIFLAAHSGNSNISYFNKLDKLNIGNFITLYYKDYKYIYKVTTIYEVDKDGDIEVNKQSNYQLVLTTCSTTNKDKQLIINSNLYKKEKV